MWTAAAEQSAAAALLCGSTSCRTGGRRLASLDQVPECVERVRSGQKPLFEDVWWHVATLFVFGAGASAFSGPCLPMAPPFGNDLFDELVKRGGVASTVDADLVDAFRQNFEAGMTLFRQRRGFDVTTFLLEMADYFARFEPDAANLYVELLNGMSDSKRKFSIATLNYDLLIELAATRIGRTVSNTLATPNRRDVIVLKPHGSCNFLPDLAPRQLYNIQVDISDITMRAAILDAPVRVANPAEVIEFCARENSMAPAIALYEKGKDTLFCPSFIRKQQAEFKSSIDRAHRIFIIGVRVNEEDEHIWKPIATADAWLYYVGPDASDFFSWARKRRRRRTNHFARSFEEAVPKIIALHTRY